MQHPSTPPTPDNIEPWRAYALAYLAEEFKEAAPTTLTKPVVFPLSPLESEGATVLFEFEANRTGAGMERYFVVVGETEPNYYAAYDLNAEDAFALHLGTRFMLVMGVAQVDNEKSDAATYDPIRDAREIVDRVAPDKTVTDVEIAATFDVEGTFHAVLRCKIAGEPVYVMGRDAPQGFSRRTDLLPHVVYRIHLGNVLLQEAKPGDE